MNSTRISILSLLLLLLVSTQVVMGQYEIVLIEEESSLWIEGTSNVQDIFCKAGLIVGYANIETTNIRENVENNNNGAVRLNIPVFEFDCGRRQMNRDFFRALKADAYPTIEFQYHSARLITNLDPECHPFQLEVEGELLVAGKGQLITVMVDIEPCELNRFRLKGSKTINMKDFGIEPPSALFGLVRANEMLEVHFSLTAEQRYTKKQ